MNRALLLVLALCVVFVNATEIFILKDGDRISGELKGFEADCVIVDSNFLGAVKIPWDNIVSVKSTRQLYYRSDSGSIIAAQNIDRKQVEMIGLTEDDVNPDVIRAREEAAKATATSKLWSGYLEVNLSGSTGNKEEIILNGIGHAERAGSNNKFIAHIDGKYGKTEDEISNKELVAWLKESVDLVGRLYAYGRLEGTWDRVKEINYQVVGELGLGLHIIQDGDFHMFEGDKITLDWDLGLTYTYTDYRNHTEDSDAAGFVTRLTYNQIFPNNWKFYAMGEYAKDFEDPDNNDRLDWEDSYRLKGELRLEIPISDVLFFTASIRDEYNNAPAKGVERNDFYYLMGLKLTF
jgi:hypothetical protein